MAYALVVSLKRTFDPLLDSARSKIQIPNLELKLIHDDLCYIKSFFDEMNSLKDSNSAEELEKDIKDVLENTQDLIESHLSDLVLSESQSSGDESSISGFAEELVKVKDMLRAKKDELTILKAKKDAMSKAKKDEMLEAEEDALTVDQHSAGPFAADVAVSSEIDFGRNHMVVGLEDEILMLMDWLTSGGSRLQVISIVGMAGTGKTTLAKKVYLNRLLVEYYDFRLFVEIGLQYELDDILLRLPGQLFPKEMKELNVHEIGEQLYKYLFGRRYLVVLDDICDTRAWSELRRVFPDNRNGSAIIFTTRLPDAVGDGFHKEKILRKRFLNHHERWNLLYKMVFSDTEMCPSELEEIGKTIAKNLDGLPAAIVEIGKLLYNSPTTVESWTAVAQNIKNIQETTILKILNPSYAQLPQHLKACFLYMGLYPPNYNIPTYLLFRLWVAEGFIVPAPNKSLEQVAEEYLKDLVSRSFVIVHQLSSTGRIRTCRLHQVLQNLCVREARHQKLFHIVKGGTTSFPQGEENQRRLGVHRNVVLGFRQVHNSMESVPAARSLLCVGPQHQHPIQLYLGFRWLRVLHALSIIFRKFPDEVPNLVRLRYLAITYNGELPSSISRLLDLEVLIVHPSQRIESFIFLPLEIWKLQKLRHLECLGYDLPDPSTGDGNECVDEVVLMYLQTLCGVSHHRFTVDLAKRMPNLIKLGIWFEPTRHAVENFFPDALFIHLHKLESFKCQVMNPYLPSYPHAFSLLGFPNSLKKLTLSGCGFLWDVHMMALSRLPCLEVLKLRWDAFRGPVWELNDCEFLRLTVLVLENLDIESFIAEDTNFPCLRRLLIRGCYKLQEIPLEIGEIPTLELIEVDDSSMSVIESARLIKEEQESWGNEGLQIRIHSSCDAY